MEGKTKKPAKASFHDYSATVKAPCYLRGGISALPAPMLSAWCPGPGW
jgi:hypothetical protein